MSSGTGEWGGVNLQILLDIFFDTIYNRYDMVSVLKKSICFCRTERGARGNSAARHLALPIAKSRFGAVVARSDTFCLRYRAYEWRLHGLNLGGTTESPSHGGGDSVYFFNREEVRTV